MKKEIFTIWKRDPDASLWQAISLFGFWLRYPNAHSPEGLNPLAVPKGLKEAEEGFLRYGAELRILEHDLTECVNEFQQGHETPYHDPEHLNLKKFAVDYHVDNLHVRVHDVVEHAHVGGVASSNRGERAP